jgi:5'-3' exonuclease
VFLTIDGPAPVAKVMTQRERRVNTALAYLEGEARPPVDTLQFIPGTEFMHDFHQVSQSSIPSIAANDAQHMTWCCIQGLCI